MASNQYNTMYNPDVLSCIANLSNDEVFTPPEVANAMLDLLSQEKCHHPARARAVQEGDCLNVKDFELLVSLNVFNETLMNDAVYKFKRYDDASLVYTGLDRHVGEDVGLYSTVVSRTDYDAMAGQLAASMEAEPASVHDTFEVDDTYEERYGKVAEHEKPLGSEKTAGQAEAIGYKAAIPIDTGRIHAGTAVSHKAFGMGKVSELLQLFTLCSVFLTFLH